MAFKSIEDIEGSLMTYLEGRGGGIEIKREPAKIEM
jgi:hypothetical protein